MLGPRQLKLVEALESGEYNQTTRVLKNDEGYCCLGLACELAKEDLGCDWAPGSNTFLGYEEILPRKVMYYYNFTTTTGNFGSTKQCLTNLNDGVGGYCQNTFKEIAQVIRDNSERIFSSPV